MLSASTIDFRDCFTSSMHSGGLKNGVGGVMRLRESLINVVSVKQINTDERSTKFKGCSANIDIEFSLFGENGDLKPL